MLLYWNKCLVLPKGFTYMMTIRWVNIKEILFEKKAAVFFSLYLLSRKKRHMPLDVHFFMLLIYLYCQEKCANDTHTHFDLLKCL